MSCLPLFMHSVTAFATLQFILLKIVQGPLFRCSRYQLDDTKVILTIPFYSLAKCREDKLRIIIDLLSSPESSPDVSNQDHSTSSLSMFCYSVPERS